MALKYSNSAKAKQKRIEKLPKLFQDIALTSTKKDAEGVVKEFRKGIINNSFGFEALAESTIDNKKSKGFDKPSTPLYGKGERRKKDTYLNILRMRKKGNGYQVYVSNQKHWSGKLTLHDLFMIHEYGASISKDNGTVIKIPARPAFQESYRAWLRIRLKDKRETSRLVKKAIKEYIKTGNERAFNQLIDKTQGEFEE